MKKGLFSAFSLFLLFQFCNNLTYGQAPIIPNNWSGFVGASTTGASMFAMLPATTAPGSALVNVSQWNRGGSINNTSAGATYNSSNWLNGGTLAGAQAANSDVYFTVTTDANTELRIDSVVLSSRVSTTGPPNLQLMYNVGTGDIAFGSGITVTTFGSVITLRFIGTTPLHLCPSTTATFKLYGWGASTAAGTLRINDTSLIGASFASYVTSTPTCTPTSVCAGQSVNFAGRRANGVPAYTYQWNGPGGFSTATRNPFIFFATAGATGVYSFTVTDSWGCSAVGTTTLTVNPTPPVPTVTPSGTVTICSNDSLVLTGPTGYTYQWDTGSYATPYAIPGATNITYTARLPRRYRLLITNSSGCSTLGTPPTTLLVNAAASNTVTASGALSFCTGGSVTLTSTASGGGLTYQWYDSVSSASSATAIAGANTASYTATTSGRYFVRITNASGCISQSILFTIVEVTLPVISTIDATSFCQGGTARLTVSISAGATGVQCQWKKNSINIPGATSTTYIVTSTGDYTCFVNIPGGCSITTNTVHVNVRPTPVPLIAFSGNKFSTYGYYARYQWYINTVTIPGATTKTVREVGLGSYRVMVTDTFGCTKLSDAYSLNTLSVNEVTGINEVIIYPNPSNGILHIDAAWEVNGTVSSMEGKVVMQFNQQKDIDISSLPQGLYIVMLYDQNNTRLHVEKIMKQ